ncbi:MAG: cupin domain-containing protein [Lachnospiraceae bacterium]
MDIFNNYFGFQADQGNRPYAASFDMLAMTNPFFRETVWTGDHLQITMMSIDKDSEIGLECHEHLDQFLYIVYGYGKVYMGRTKTALDFTREVKSGFGIVVPAGKWHNLVNTGNCDLKLFSVYAPPGHPFGTLHRTKAEAEEEEKY